MSSTRPSTRLEFQYQKGAEFSGFDVPKGNGSIPLQGIIPTLVGEGVAEEEQVAAMANRKSHQHRKRERLSRKDLEQIERRLSARDHAVLQAIRKYRFLTSD